MQHSEGAITALRARYPSLDGLPDRQLADDLSRDARALAVAFGSRLFEEGMSCAGFPLVLEGEVRVAHGAANGRSLDLYRVLPGEVCIVSAAGLLTGRPMMAHGTAVQNTRLILLSPGLFNRWTDHHPFRQFVFGVFAERLADLMAVVDAVAFQRLDRRLADYLLGHGPVVFATHQAVADELGTVREIITRLLNRFASAGAVQLGRERIQVGDTVRLRAIAEGHDASLD